MSAEEEDWPYEKIEAVEPEEAPSWLCPEQKCTCSEKEEKGEPYTFTIMLCEPSGERMPGARCRVVVNGILANEDEPNADGAGWISVELERAPETVQVEWAPAGTPIREDLPYRRRYYVDLCEQDPAQATRRRLHNLGFAYFDTLRENIEDFQCEYDQPQVTGEIEDVAAPLRAYHDAAMVPVTRERTAKDAPRGFRLAAFDGNDDPKSPGNNLPQPPPPPPGSTGPTGTVKPPLSRKTNLSSILDVIDQGLHQFEWIAIPTSAGGLDAIFWVFKDALMHKGTGRRWPCSPHEAQLACGKIRSTPAGLPGWPTEASSGGGAEDSLFLTPKLMDVRWAQAERAGQAIEPRAQNINGDTAVENGKLNRWVDSQIKPGWLVADPGKIWAIANRMAGVIIAGLPAAINYGWHVQTSKVAISRKNPKEGTWGGGPVKPAVSPPGQWCVQWEEMGHNTAWIDYSQLLILAAGWCVVRTSGGGTYSAERTEDVYKNTSRAALVTADGKPLTITKQPLPATPAQKKTAAKQAQLQKDLDERRFRTARIEERKKGGTGPLTA